MAQRQPFTRYTPSDRTAALARYEAAIERGLAETAAALEANVSIGTLHSWRDKAADAAARPSTVARRRCLRCGQTFRSTWAGNRTCDPCARGHALDGLPDGWGATSTTGVGDRG